MLPSQRHAMGGGVVPVSSSGEGLRARRRARPDGDRDRAPLSFAIHLCAIGVTHRSSPSLNRSIWPSASPAHGQGESFADPSQLVRDLTAYLATPSQAAFTATIVPRGNAHRLAWWTFRAGAAILALWGLGWLFPGLRPKTRP